MAAVQHSTLKVGPVTVFYREAGLDGNPVLWLLHGFANSSHYFRHLMPLLASRFHLIAPDLPLFGFTKVDGESYRYTFAQLTETTQAFVDALRLGRFAMYVFDYGAPIGFNLAVADPSRITAIVSQNGNAYEEGLGEGPWAPLRAYWKQPSAAIREPAQTTYVARWCLRGVLPGSSRCLQDRTRSLLARCCTPRTTGHDGPPSRSQARLQGQPRTLSFISTVPPYASALLLAIWGKNDSFFVPPGAEAFQRDVPKAVVKFLDAGHFALETNLEDIASAILEMPM
jgi:pimeloyl-ACP methyl ester carboxylesterase